ncbi:MAG: DUF3572 family protein [Alteraurantiacibacter sp.]
MGLITISHAPEDSVKDASALALAALGWVLADEKRAQRLLDLTGLTPDGLRDAITETQTHRAILDFLCQHEPDLIGAAEALEIAPERLVAAGRELRR